MRIEAPWWRTEPIRTRLRFVWRRVDDLAFGLTVAAIVLVVILVWWRSLDGGLPFIPRGGPPLAAFGPENPFADVWPAGGAAPAHETEEREVAPPRRRGAGQLEIQAIVDPTAPPFRSTQQPSGGSGGGGAGTSQDPWQVPGPGGGSLPGGGGGGGGSSSPTPSSGPSPSPTPTTSPDPDPEPTTSPSPDPEPTSEPTSSPSPCKSLPPNAQGDPCKGD